MEHKDPIPMYTVNPEELEVVAARIRPLPREVAPSPEFMSRTRLRLLQLKPEATADQSRRAA